jgi:hypothetical protein
MAIKLIIETITKMLDSYEVGSEKMELLVLKKSNNKIVSE